jgi:hypothetical protein
MPLINLTTDLKSLRYGADRPGGGSSGLPYIISPTPDELNVAQFPLKPNDFLDYYSLNRDTRDFPIRGGSIEIGGADGISTTPAGRIDRARIQAFMRDPARGKIFLLKQTGLQLTNPKMQVPGTIQIANSNQEIGILETTRVYNPTGLTTILQTAAQGTGTHIVRHGTTPDYTGFFTLGYDYFVRANNDDLSNRLILLRNSKLLTDSPITSTYIGKSNDYGISTLTDQILNYEGGPGSTYGIGRTIVKRAVNTNTSRVYSSVAFNYDTIARQSTTTGTERAHPNVQDFRATINRQLRTANRIQLTEDYDKNWIQNRLKTGNPGGPRDTSGNFKGAPVDNSGADELNMQGLFYYNTSTKPWEASTYGKTPAEDMIKFVFECMSNDAPNSAVAIFFRSFLTGITDNHQAEFNSFKYLGRGETFRTYQGFDRSISFSFKIAAFSQQEMQPLYTKLNHLISQIYPDYSPTTQFMRGNVIRLTVGDYLYRVPGFLENVNITIDDNVAWDIALLDKNVERQLPQVISVQCTFKPIHDILPRREKYTDGYVPLIANTPAQYLAGDVEAARTPVVSPVTQELEPPAVVPTTLQGAQPSFPTLQNFTSALIYTDVENQTRAVLEQRP